MKNRIDFAWVAGVAPVFATVETQHALLAQDAAEYMCEHDDGGAH